MRRVLQNRKLRVLLIVMAVPVLAAAAWITRRVYLHLTWDPWHRLPEAPTSVRGMLRTAAFGPSVIPMRARNSMPQRTRYVVGPHYDGMEDNDLRGFLDGRFIAGYNQVGQIHVRAGRRGAGPHFGEYGLFRVLQRWDDLRLPRSAQISRVRLRVHIEESSLYDPLEVMLYAAQKDWNPGQGGTRRDNTSPPATGEVWWNDAAFGEQPWGLPGAGFASDSSSEADTGAMPLASASVEKNQDSFVFESKRLSAYVQDRVEQSAPILLLIKLSDAFEDRRGSQINFYSRDEGDQLNTARRPSLEIDWTSEAQIASHEQNVFLEPGRELVSPRIDAPHAEHVSVSFDTAEGHASPTLYIRGGQGGGAASEWWPAAIPRRVSWDWFQVRVLAAENPLVLGEWFESELADTWILSAPPEKQVVPCTFVSPDGDEHETTAEYLGDYRWRLRYRPTSVGRWTYTFRQTFLEDHPYRSARGVFDVIGGSHENIVEQLMALKKRIEAAKSLSTSERMDRYGAPFWRLERAALQKMNPKTFRSDSGRRLRGLLDEIREALSGETVPEEQVPAGMEREW